MAHEYKLRKEDFIPIVGVIKHYKRSVNELARNQIEDKEYYVGQAWGREAFLTLYNFAVATGTAATGFGIAKGIELLVK
jgi:hypothetical protein